MKSYSRYFMVACTHLMACYPASAGCTLAGYDSTSPEALFGNVGLNGEDFDYSSDLDRVGDRTYIWNYVKNNSTSRNVSISWPKGSISLNILDPLAPSGIACARYLAHGISDDDIDYKALLSYGNANHEQIAPAYSAADSTAAKSEEIKSDINLQYSDNGTSKEIDVSFYFKLNDGIIEDMKMTSPSGYYVGITDVTDYWSESTTESFFTAAKQQERAAIYSSWSDFGSDAGTLKAFLAHAGVNGSNALFASGTVSGFGIGDSVSNIKNVDVIVFDSDRRPIVSSRISLPVTK